MCDLKVVLPGDKVSLPSPKVGPGLFVSEEECSSALASIAGVLRETGEEGNRKTWVDYSAKRVKG